MLAQGFLLVDPAPQPGRDFSVSHPELTELVISGTCDLMRPQACKFEFEFDGPEGLMNLATLRAGAELKVSFDEDEVEETVQGCKTLTSTRTATLKNETGSIEFQAVTILTLDRACPFEMGHFLDAAVTSQVVGQTRYRLTSTEDLGPLPEQ